VWFWLRHKLHWYRIWYAFLKVHLLHCTGRSNPKNNAMSCSIVAASFWVALLLSTRGGCIM
jgi:hypothetical protein